MVEEGAICKFSSNKIAGTLALGSRKKGKFTEDSETLFLEFVLAVLSHQIDSLIGEIDA